MQIYKTIIIIIKFSLKYLNQVVSNHTYPYHNPIYSESLSKSVNLLLLIDFLERYV